MQSHTRTQAHLACEECRRRKARCDRVRPQCGTCAELGYVCVVNEKRPQRGPKKGQMNALRARVATLERQLNARNIEIPDEPQDLDDAPYTTTAHCNQQETSMITPALTTAASTVHSSEDDSHPHDAMSNLDNGPFPLFDFSTMILPNQPYYGAGDAPNEAMMDTGATLHGMKMDHSDCGLGLLLEIPLLTRADLDDLFFDRVYPIAPIIHRRRYLAWSQSQSDHHDRSTLQLCLQYAMWAVAAAVSSQFRQLADKLADGAIQMLNHLSVVSQDINTITPLAQIQAWLLIAHYELLCKSDRQAMLTAGRAIRLVQLARLHELDADEDQFTTPASCPALDADTFVEMEEQRRTFWLAYSFDRFCLLRNNWHSSIPEELIRTRLPAPEGKFQNSQPVRTDFLPKAISNSGKGGVLPPFAEAIVLEALFSHCIVHQRLMTVEPSLNNSNNNNKRDLWNKHAWLSLAVEKRNRLLSQQSQPRNLGYMPDPMLLFSDVLAKCLRMYLSCIRPRSAAASDWDGAGSRPDEQEPEMEQDPQEELSSLEHNDRAMESLNDLVQLAKTLPKFSCFKMHPCLPNLLYRTILLLVEEERSMGPRIWTSDAHAEILTALLAALSALQDVNNLAKVLLAKLEPLELPLC
ncbi:hypothetical protein VHEMI01586 [[Torrubiella] hemipterigena]|uniref:Zn(2)-C6 fungal-type domain-containing protein n=1 Tax=[Torrubiella] hemipterigena TaxID=1531966 RepID=A0A0A1T7X2_9HYPO|nr:hypothetical protein VHEMI01586 [[Torrubiella] hemipterigena]